MGDYNSSRFTGELMYTPIVHKHWFNFKLMDIQVDGKSIGVPTIFYEFRNDVLGSFVDSGTSVVLLGTYTFGQLQGLLQTVSFSIFLSFSFLDRSSKK